MEEILIVLVQLVVEVLLQCAVYAPFDLPVRRNESSGERTGYGWLIIYLVLGGLMGGLSLLVFPRHLIHTSSFRLVNLLVAPIFAGGLSWGLAAWRRSRGKAAIPSTHFWTALCFVLAFAAVRLAYAAN